MSRIMLALGGNALGNSVKEQLEIVKDTAVSVVDLIEQGHEIVVTHGNGPQVGMINLGMEIASTNDKRVDSMPLPECGAMSQGYIGYHLQNAIGKELKRRKINKNAVSIVTQVLVDKNDSAFDFPSKPIGTFYSREQAEEIEKEKKYIMKEDSGRGYRRVVPSPKPVDVVEKDAVISLLEAGQLVITGGGGGIPVIEDEDGLRGVNAVIDKDHASAKIAEIIEADFLFILTAVDKIYINFGKENEKALDELNAKTAEEYIARGEFPAGSMLPKVEAAVNFAKSKKGRKVIISSLAKAKEALLGKNGTVICA